MTARCGGGASLSKPGTAQHVVVSAGLITEGLGLITPWLLPVAVLIDAFVYEVLTQCTGDPPAMPTPDQLDIRNALGGVLNPNYGAWLSAVNNLLLNWAWDQFCTCAAGAPTAVVYPGPPTSTSVPGGSTATPCFVGDVTRVIAQEPVPNFDSQPANPTLFPTNGVIYTKVDSGHNIDFATLLTTPLSCTLNVHCTGLTVGVTYVSQIVWLDAAHNYLSPSGGGNFFSQSVSEDHSWTFAVPAGAVFGHYEASRVDAVADVSSTYHATATWFCGTAAPTGPSTPCVDSYEMLQVLNNIQKVLNAVYRNLEPSPPIYIAGAVHPGLSGSGTITLGAGAIAVKVDVTSDTSLRRISVGSPNYLWDRGRIVAIAAGTPLRVPSRLAYNPQLYRLPHPTDQVGYTLPLGVTITITELSGG